MLGIGYLIFPSRHLGTLLPSIDFQFLLKFRLGIFPLSNASACNCCQKDIFFSDADMAGESCPLLREVGIRSPPLCPMQSSAVSFDLTWGVYHL